MLTHQYVHDLPLLSLLACELGPGSSLQMMPSMPDARVTITSTLDARWYAIDPGLIRPLTDQNPLAHSLRPIDMTRHGWLSSRRQASQQ